MKIATLSLALVAVLFVMNSKAYDSAANNAGTLTMQIHGTPGYCLYGTSLNLGTHAFSYAAQSQTGQFYATTEAGTTTGAQWSCTDSYGIASRTLTIAASDLTDATAIASHTIANENIRVYADKPAVVSGSCTEIGGLSGWNDLGGTVTLISKSGVIGDACRIATNNVKIDVAYPASQAIGSYTSDITLNLPPLETLL